MFVVRYVFGKVALTTVITASRVHGIPVSNLKERVIWFASACVRVSAFVRVYVFPCVYLLYICVCVVCGVTREWGEREGERGRGIREEREEATTHLVCLAELLLGSPFLLFILVSFQFFDVLYYPLCNHFFFRISNVNRNQPEQKNGGGGSEKRREQMRTGGLTCVCVCWCVGVVCVVYVVWGVSRAAP